MHHGSCRPGCKRSPVSDRKKGISKDKAYGLIII